MTTARIAQYTKAFTGQLNTLAVHHAPFEIFHAFADIAALTIHQRPYHAGMVPKDDAFTRIEGAYMDAIRPYAHDELAGFVALYSLTTLAVSAWPAPDFLGRLLLALDIHNARAGQYCTPTGGRPVDGADAVAGCRCPDGHPRVYHRY